MTLTDTIVQSFRERIRNSELKQGDKLPSIRKSAQEFGVSKNTVVEAYDRLLAAGMITSRQGYGFTVVDTSRQSPSARLKHVTEAVDVVSLLSAQLEQSFTIRVGDGRPPPSWTEQSEVRRYLNRAQKFGNVDRDGYGSAMGLPELRERLALDIIRREVAVDPDQILLTFGANHALDLIIRHYLAPGDTAFVDEPGYYPLFAKLKLAQVNIVGIRRQPSGPDIEDLEAKTRRYKPRLFFTQSTGHNPTGGFTNLPTAHALLNIAAKNKFLVVEDEPFSDLPGIQGTGLMPLDQLDNVIYVGTFSKTLSASLRCGFIAARSDIVSDLAELKMLTTVNSSGHIEHLVHGLIAEGHYSRHLKRLSQRIARATERVMTNLDRLGLTTFSPPGGGYYLYLNLPDKAPDIDLAKAGAREDILIAPGSVFCADTDHGSSGIRINIARADSAKFYDFLKRHVLA